MATNRLLAWNFETPDINRLISPIQQGVRDYRQIQQQGIENERQNKLMGFRQQEMDMSRERFGMEKDAAAEKKQQAIRERAGNLALVALSMDEGTRAAKWGEFMKTHPNAATLDPTYHDPRTGPLKILAEAGMSQNYLDWQMKQAAERRASAQLGLAQNADARAAALHGPQLESAQTAALAAKRDLDAPKTSLNIVPEGGTLVSTNPRTGQHQVVASGGPKELKDFQTKDAMWAERINRSESNIDTIAGIDGAGKPKQGAYNPASGWNRFAPDDPSIWNLYTANLFNSTNWQRYQQAAREGIAAVLRKDTGAAVTKEEWNLYFPMYYPQPGDAPAVVKQKKEARDALFQALKGASGPAYDRMFPPKSMAPSQPAQDPLGIR